MIAKKIKIMQDSNTENMLDTVLITHCDIITVNNILSALSLNKIRLQVINIRYINYKINYFSKKSVKGNFYNLPKIKYGSIGKNLTSEIVTNTNNQSQSQSQSKSQSQDDAIARNKQKEEERRQKELKEEEHKQESLKYKKLQEYVDTQLNGVIPGNDDDPARRRYQKNVYNSTEKIKKLLKIQEKNIEHLLKLILKNQKWWWRRYRF